MKYLLIAILNAVYGLMVLSAVDSSTAGYYLILAVSIVISVLGISGLILYSATFFSTLKKTGTVDLYLKSWFSLTKNVDIVLILGLLFRAFIVQPFIVDGISMEKNFQNNEYILVDQISYKFRQIKRGEVIVFQPTENANTDYIKRVIGLPGETVLIENSQIYINGHLLNESYLTAGTVTYTSEKTFRKTVMPNEYFVMGDNREHSSDSREFGTVPKKNIVGKAWIKVYPFDNIGIIKNPDVNLYNSVPASAVLNINN